MASVRIKRKQRPDAPVAFVPLEPNKVVVVPTDDIPRPDALNTPENQEYLLQQAENIASPASQSQPTTEVASPGPLQLLSPSSSESRPRSQTFTAGRFRPTPSRLRSQTVSTPKSPRDVQTRRAAASVFSGSRDSVGADNRSDTRRRDSAAEDEAGEEGQSQRRTWFVDHVLRSSRLSNASSLRPRLPFTAEKREANEGLRPPSSQSIRPPSSQRSPRRTPRTLESPELARRSTSSDALSIAGSVPQVNVIIPREVRSGLGRALASQEQVRQQEEREERAERVQRRDSMSEAPTDAGTLHHNEIIEHLDVIDAHIATVSHLSNTANSIILPPLSIYSRKPVITMPVRMRARVSEEGSEDELDLHVEDILKGPDKLRRSLQGLWAFLKTPIGIVSAIYGFNVVFWGAAIVFFLGKIINLHNPYRQGFWVEVSSQVVNGLFTVMGVGFLPWRIMDTWNVLWIYHYDRLDQKLRRRAGLPPVGDHSDIPDPLLESEHVQMLSDQQLVSLRRHQVRFMKSQTWYRPHATETHRAFSLKWAISICLLVDLNSVFQILLCGCMWSLNRFQRPAWTTGSLIPLGFLSGIGAGILIWKGGERCKKTKEVEAHLRAALAQEKAVLKARYGETEEEGHGVPLGLGMAEETARMGIGGLGGPPSLVEKPSILGPSDAKAPAGRPSSAETNRTDNSDGTSPSGPSNQSRPQRSPQRSPPLPSIHIDETMTIPEAQELTSSTTKSQSALDREEKDFYHPEALNKV